MSGVDEIARLVSLGARFMMERNEEARAVRCQLRQNCGDQTYVLDRYFDDRQLATNGDYSFVDSVLEKMAREWSAKDERRLRPPFAPSSAGRSLIGFG